MSTVALAFMVNKLTGSMLHMGAVMAVAILPLALASWVAGALLDRYSSSWLMVLADAGRAVLVFSMPLVATQSVLLIYVIAALIGVFSAVFNPGQIKLIGEMSTRAGLVKANSYLGISRDGAELIGYVAGGAVVTAFGYIPAFMVDSATYVLSALLLIGLPRPAARVGMSPQVLTLIADTPKVFARLWRHPALKTNLLFALLPLCALGLYVPNSYGLVLDVYARGGLELGILEWAVGCGLIVGGIVISRMSLAGDKNRYVISSLVAVAFCLLGVYFCRALWPSIALLGVAGMMSAGMTVPSITLLQEASGSEDKGRLISLRAGFGQLSAAIGYLLGGLLGDAIGIQRVFGVAGAAAIILGILIYVPYRLGAHRRADAVFKQAVATGERRVAARRAAVNAALNGHPGAWVVPEMVTEEES
jgi:MFS family permease